MVQPLALVERRLRDRLLACDPVTFAPVHAIALAASKRIRASLVLVSARAVGMPEPSAIELAVAVEIVHTFSLVHDDIEDGAPLRRGQPAVHVAHGVPVALNAGDALHALAWSTVLELEAVPERAVAVARMLGVTLERMVGGQARDLIWTRDRVREISFADYLAMVRGKTGALMGFAAAAPAWLAGHPGASHLYGFGEELGVALQLLDDVAAVRGDPLRLGKPVGPGATGVGSAPALLSDDLGTGAERATEQAREHAARAIRELAAAGLDGPGELRVFADVMIARLVDAATARDRAAG